MHYVTRKALRVVLTASASPRRIEFIRCCRALLGDRQISLTVKAITTQVTYGVAYIRSRLTISTSELAANHV